jgi:glucokinase
VDNDDRGLAIGLDIGGTKISCGVISATGIAVNSLRPISTPVSQDMTLSTLRGAIDQLLAACPGVTAIGVGAAGLVDWPTGFVRWAPNNAYREMPLRRLLEDGYGLPTVVDNDANVAAFAEARLGQSARYLLFLTVGTGLGGGIVLDGQLFRGSTGIGAEVGHMIVDPFGGHKCGCGRVGCLEALASGTALGSYGREAAAAEPHGTLARLAGGHAAVSGETVFAAAMAGDATALALYARLGRWLGIGIASLVTLFDIELIIVGGGVAKAGKLLLDPARAALDTYLFAREHRAVPRIIQATLGVEAGWIGAGLLALDLHRETPRGSRSPRSARSGPA